ncbi:MAG: CPBP family intramembrane metalloprotease [Gammaproteobacteria bacterium]|nr:MAG: CPBP family intramembrane metalloprotease [Gammaproteobacteria bacterium]
MRRLFWNATERRPRTFWRLTGQLLILVATLMLLDELTAPLATAFPGHGAALAETIVGVLAFVLSVGLAGRWLDQRPLADFGLHVLARPWWRQLVTGLCVGPLLMSGIFLFEYLLGYVEIVEVGYVIEPGVPLAASILIPIGLYLSIAVSEEVLFRGYYLRNLAEGMAGKLSLPARAVVAALISSALFGLTHAGNPAATWISTVYLCLFGLMFALGYLLTGQLALPIGLHWSWNLFQGNVFGFPVSGKAVDGGGILRITQTGPDWLTGGSFGPEAGAAGLGALAAGCLMIVLYCRQTQGRLQLQGISYGCARPEPLSGQAPERGPADS